MQDFFITKDNIRVPAVTTEQMKEIERIAIEETGLSKEKCGKLLLGDI